MINIKINYLWLWYFVGCSVGHLNGEILEEDGFQSCLHKHPESHKGRGSRKVSQWKRMDTN